MKRIIALLFSVAILFAASFTIAVATSDNSQEIGSELDTVSTLAQEYSYAPNSSSNNTTAVLCKIAVQYDDSYENYSLCYSSEDGIQLLDSDENLAQIENAVQINQQGWENVPTNFTVTATDKTLTVSFSSDSAGEETWISIPDDVSGLIFVNFYSVKDGISQNVASKTENSTQKLSEISTCVDEDSIDNSGGNSTETKTSNTKVWKILAIVEIVLIVLLIVAWVVFVEILDKSKRKAKSVRRKRENENDSKEKNDDFSHETDEISDVGISYSEIKGYDDSGKQTDPDYADLVSDTMDSLKIDSVLVEPEQHRSFLESVKDGIVAAYQNGTDFPFVFSYAYMDEAESMMNGSPVVKVNTSSKVHFVIFEDSDTDKAYLLPNPIFYNEIRIQFTLSDATLGKCITVFGSEQGKITDFLPTELQKESAGIYNIHKKGRIIWN